MGEFLLIAGVIVTILGLCVLVYLIVKTRNAGVLSEADQTKFYEKLIAVNFLGVALGVFGLILVILSFVFN